MRIIGIAIFAFFCHSLIASDSIKTNTPRKVFKGAGVAYSLSKFRDQGHSPLLYRGPEVYLFTFRERCRNTYHTRLEMNFAYGMLTVTKKQTYFRTQLQSIRAEFNYHWLFNLSDSTRKVSWQIGPMLGNSIDNRLYLFLPNNLYSFQYANFLGISTSAQKNVLWRKKRTLVLNWRAHMALLAHDIRPNYIGMEPAETYEGANISILPMFYKENKILLPNKFFLLRSEFNTSILRSNKKSLQLLYAWSFGFDTSSNPMIFAKHYVGFAKTITKIRYKKRLVWPWKKQADNPPLN